MLLNTEYIVVAGPPGPPGDTGATGQPGPRGQTGALGPIGFTGPTGSVGREIIDHNGVRGSTGLDGATGDRGATGTSVVIELPSFRSTKRVRRPTHFVYVHVSCNDSYVSLQNKLENSLDSVFLSTSSVWFTLEEHTL